MGEDGEVQRRSRFVLSLFLCVCVSQLRSGKEKEAEGEGQGVSFRAYIFSSYRGEKEEGREGGRSCLAKTSSGVRQDGREDR